MLQSETVLKIPTTKFTVLDVSPKDGDDNDEWLLQRRRARDPALPCPRWL